MKGRFWEKLIAAGQLCAEAARNLKTFLKWILMALITGGVVGGVGSLFYYTLSWATQFRQDHSWTLFLLPVAGLLIIFLYRVSNTPEPKGTNLVIEAVRTDTHIPAKMAPLMVPPDGRALPCSWGAAWGTCWDVFSIQTRCIRTL